MQVNLTLSPILVALAITLTTAACGGAATVDAKVESTLATNVRAGHPSMVRCYERALARDPATRGEMTIAFDVGNGSDRLENLSVVKSTVGDRDLERCVLTQAGRMKLAARLATGATVRVMQPLVFEPR
jgi:hypothetical protein